MDQSGSRTGADLVVLRPGLEEAALADRHLEWADRLLDSAAADLEDHRAALEVVLAGHRAVLAEASAAAIAKADSAQ